MDTFTHSELKHLNKMVRKYTNHYFSVFLRFEVKLQAQKSLSTAMLHI